MQADVLVTHPYKHHALNLAAGCVRSGLSTALALPFYRSGLGVAVAGLPGGIGRKAAGYYHPGLDAVRLMQAPLWQFRKLASFLGNPRSIEGPYDRYVATRLLRGDWKARIVVTLQDHMPETSAAAKATGALLWSDQIINLSDEAMDRIRAHARQLGDDTVAAHSEHVNSRVLSLADIVTVPSVYTLKGIRDRLSSSTRVHDIPYGVDAGRFNVVRRTSPDRFTIVARANSIRKGGHLVMQALLRAHAEWAQRVHPRRLHVHFLGACEPALADLLGLVRQLPTLDVRDGNLPSEDVPQLLATADLFLMPTLSESMSLACVEAMQAGLPMLITEYAGVDSFVSGEMGLLVDDTVSSLDAAVRLALTDDARLARWGQQARRAAAELSWDRYEQRVADVCREAIGLCS